MSTDAKPARRMVSDPELAAMQDCSDALDDLDSPAARCRVIRWLTERYRVNHQDFDGPAEHADA